MASKCQLCLCLTAVCTIISLISATILLIREMEKDTVKAISIKQLVNWKCDEYLCH